MNVETTRFGMVEIERSRIIIFEAGLLGFSDYRKYVLLQPDDDGVFFWLQSVEAPELAFVVTDPSLWVKEYQATIRREQMEDLDLSSLDEAQVLVIVNRYERVLTGNLQGPLIINLNNYHGIQLVLAEKKWNTRHEIVQLEKPVHVATA